MPPPKKKQTSSLGRAVIRSRFQGQKAIALDEGILVSKKRQKKKRQES